jgi:hypothetical protein
MDARNMPEDLFEQIERLADRHDLEWIAHCLRVLCERRLGAAHKSKVQQRWCWEMAVQHLEEAQVAIGGAIRHRELHTR